MSFAENKVLPCRCPVMLSLALSDERGDTVQPVSPTMEGGRHGIFLTVSNRDQHLQPEADDHIAADQSGQDRFVVDVMPDFFHDFAPLLPELLWSLRINFDLDAPVTSAHFAQTGQ